MGPSGGSGGGGRGGGGCGGGGGDAGGGGGDGGGDGGDAGEEEKEEDEVYDIKTECGTCISPSPICLYTDAWDLKSYTFQKRFPGNLKPQVGGGGGGKGLGKPSKGENVLFW